MPISIWLNENEKKLGVDQWIDLISDIMRNLEEIFEFKVEFYQLWNKSFFSQSGGNLIFTISSKELGKYNSFNDFIKKGLDNKYILKISGIMNKPVYAKAFLIFFLRSEDRFEMPHIFFDTEIYEADLVDELWKIKDKKDYCYLIMDYFHQIRVKLDEKEHRIIDRIIVAKDFPDDESIKDGKVLLYYISGTEYRLIKEMIKNYIEKNNNKDKKEKYKKKISILNINEFSKEFYFNDDIQKIWYKSPEEASIIPYGSLGLISNTEDGISNIFKSLENEVIKPFVNAVPEDLKDNIIKAIKNRKISKLEYSTLNKENKNNPNKNNKVIGE